jgi:hypothetical protein
MAVLKECPHGAVLGESLIADLVRVRELVLGHQRWRNLQSHPARRFWGMTIDPAVSQAVSSSQCPQCDSRRATPLLSGEPYYPYSDRVHAICDNCAQRRVVSIGPDAA